MIVEADIIEDDNEQGDQIVQGKSRLECWLTPLTRLLYQ